MKEITLHGILHNCPNNYGLIDKKDILNIHKYLIKKKMFHGFIKLVFVALLIFEDN